ncbi:MAG TPA: hypothetical protein VMF30_18005 [Pirellulales bacterium]|nr:hypothetical protein [Pirellulales bacterium]
MIKARELKRRYELEGPQKTVADLSGALAKREVRPQDFSIRALAEALVPDGREWLDSLDPRRGGFIQEAGDAVDVTAFSNITGQIIYTTIMEAYQREEFVMSRLVSTIPTRFDGEKIAGIAGLVDDISEIRPGMPYPSVGFGEDYIETPSTTKRGFIVPVTKEAIFFDRTHLILARAAEVGEVLGLNKEKRLLDLVIGVTNNYNWQGTAYNTFQTSGPWINTLAGNELVDWTNVDNAEQLFANILDPNTGEPVLISANQVLVCPQYHAAARRVFNASLIDYTTLGGPTRTRVEADLLLRQPTYQVEESRLMYRRLLAAGVTNPQAVWLLADFRKAFAYMENWPITVTQATQNSEAEFTQDIVVRFKASERGAAAVLNPRYVVMSTS